MPPPPSRDPVCEFLFFGCHEQANGCRVTLLATPEPGTRAGGPLADRGALAGRGE
jgi:hypothetical protein